MSATAAAPVLAPPVLRLRDVRHAFDGSTGPSEVLAGVDLDVREGEFVALMGPSGSGKSTLLSILAGFLPATGGTVEYRGRAIGRPGAERGTVLQRPALFPWLDVEQNVLFGPRATGRADGARERARTLLAEVGLRGFEHHRPHELSGGMQHRAALARTLVNEPDVLLMDEPFAALDAQRREELQALLLDVWQRRRCTVVFVTHDIEEGLLLADRIVLLGTPPTGVREVVDVPLPRPRDPDVVLDPQFLELRRRVRALLQPVPTHPR